MVSDHRDVKSSTDNSEHYDDNNNNINNGSNVAVANVNTKKSIAVVISDGQREQDQRRHYKNTPTLRELIVDFWRKLSPTAAVCVAVLVALAFLGGWQAKAWNEQNLASVMDAAISKSMKTGGATTLPSLDKSTESLASTSTRIESARELLSAAADKLQSSVEKFDGRSNEFVNRVSSFNQVVTSATTQFTQASQQLIIVIAQTDLSKQLEECKKQLNATLQLKLDLAAAHEAHRDLVRWMLRTALSLQEFSLGVAVDTVAGASGRCSDRIDELQKELTEMQTNYTTQISKFIDTARAAFDKDIKKGTLP